MIRCPRPEKSTSWEVVGRCLKFWDPVTISSKTSDRRSWDLGESSSWWECDLLGVGILLVQWACHWRWYWSGLRSAIVKSEKSKLQRRSNYGIRFPTRKQSWLDLKPSIIFHWWMPKWSQMGYPSRSIFCFPSTDAKRVEERKLMLRIAARGRWSQIVTTPGEIRKKVMYKLNGENCES